MPTSNSTCTATTRAIDNFASTRIRDDPRAEIRASRLPAVPGALARLRRALAVDGAKPRLRARRGLLLPSRAQLRGLVPAAAHGSETRVRARDGRPLLVGE